MVRLGSILVSSYRGRIKIEFFARMMHIVALGRPAVEARGVRKDACGIPSKMAVVALFLGRRTERRSERRGQSGLQPAPSWGSCSAHACDEVLEG
jgi:hypothetical protein